ncbi:MAG: 30S ribosomal protein S13 [Candidatus Helarchaeota archaeon]
MSFRHIIRIAHTDLDGNLQVPLALTKIKGIGLRYAEILTKLAEIDTQQRLGYLSDRDVKKLETLIQEKPAEIPFYMVNRQKDYKSGEDLHAIGSTLMLIRKSDIDIMKRTKSRKGMRHQLGLKVRGQRTKSTGRGGQIVGVHRRKMKQQKKKK